MTLMTRLLESTYMNDSYIEVSNFLVICVIASSEANGGPSWGYHGATGSLGGSGMQAFNP